MSTSKHLDAICLAGILLALLLTGFLLGIRAYSTPSEETGAEDLFSSVDLEDDWDTTGATRIRLTGDGAQLDGSGAYWYDGQLHIAYAGSYLLSGELTDGSLVVETEGSGIVRLMLDGVSLHCRDSAALLVRQAEKVLLTLGDGSENTVSCGESFREEATSEGIDGAIYARDDLTINGSGSLTVTGSHAHGIVCNDRLAITGGTLKVTGTEDAIHVNDSVQLTGMDLTATAGDDGIAVSNDEGTSSFLLAGGTLTIPSCREGVEAAQVTIGGGSLTITSTDDGINASGPDPSTCMLSISGGDITLLNDTGRDADGLDSNGSISISGGNTFISLNGTGPNAPLDVASELGGVCEITGGTVMAFGGSMMAESFDSSSTQGFLARSAQGEAGTEVSLTAQDGTVLLSHEVPSPFTWMILSAPELAVGDTCTLTIGETAEEVTIDNTSVSAFGAGGRGMLGGGPGNGMGREGTVDGQMPQRPDRTPAAAATATISSSAPLFLAASSPSSAAGERGSQGDSGTSSSAGEERPSQETDSSSAGSSQTQNPSTGDTQTQPPQPPEGFQTPTGDGTQNTPAPESPPGAGGQGDTAFPGRGQRPDQGDAPFGQGGAPTPEAGGQTSSVSREALILTGISALVLLVGLVIAFRFRH